jgi:hypothetical protein
MTFATKQLALLFILCFLAVPTLAQSEPPLTAAIVSEQIHTLGARHALWAIFNDAPKWSQFLGGVATGSKEWLAIAVQLHSVSDAGSSEGLELAVGEALDHHPENVLSLVVPTLDVSGVCSGPDVDDQRFDSYKLSMAEIAHRQRMVRAMRDPKFAKLRDACVSTLENSKKGIASFYQHKPD